MKIFISLSETRDGEIFFDASAHEGGGGGVHVEPFTITFYKFPELRTNGVFDWLQDIPLAKVYTQFWFNFLSAI